MAIINALTDTWNNVATTFTAIKMTVTDTTSAAGSKLIDLLVGASSKFSVGKDGSVTAAGAYSGTTAVFSGSTLDVSGTGATITFNTATLSRSGGTGAVVLAAGSSGHVVKLNTGATEILAVNTGGVSVPSGLLYAFSSTTASDGTYDAGMARKAAKVVEFNNGTKGSYAGSAFGAGSQTVSQLTAAATVGAGARSFVTDSTATLTAGIGATVTGGGANGVPVVSNGTNWLIG